MGSYRLLAKKAGHREVAQEVKVRSGLRTTVSLQLPRMQGSLVLHVDPADATVLINGKPPPPSTVSNDGAFRLPLDAGKHEVVVRKEGFVEFKHELAIEEGKEHSLPVTLRETLATLVLEVVPADAELWLNGKVHQGPRKLKLPPGAYELLVRKEGFKEKRQTLPLQQGQVETLRVVLEQRLGAITVKVTPAEAEVDIDGQRRKADARLDLPPGKHRLKVSLTGYEPQTSEVDVVEDKHTPVDVVLVKRALREVGRFSGHGEPVRSVVYLPANGQVLSAGGGKVAGLRVWEANSAKQLHATPGGGLPFQRLAVSPDGAHILTYRDLPVKDSQDVELWAAAGLKRVASIPVGSVPVAGIGFPKDSTRALVVGSNLRVQEIDLATRALSLVLPGYENWQVKAAAFAPDGRRMVVATAKSVGSTSKKPIDNRLYLVDLQNTKSIPLQLPGHKSVPLCVAFSPDGAQVLSGDKDSLLLWSVGSKPLLLRTIPVKAPILSVAFLPSGSRALTGGGDNVVRLWDLTTGTQVEAFPGHTAPVHCVAVAPDGQHAVSASDDGTVRVLRIP